jgi:hypothetical protein
VSVQTDADVAHLAVPGGQPTVLHHLLTDIAAGAARRATVAAPRGSGATHGAGGGPGPDDDVPVAFRRLQPLLVAALIVVLVAAVVLVLAQSAGLVHLPYLGGDAALRPAAAGRLG